MLNVTHGRQRCTQKARFFFAGSRTIRVVHSVSVIYSENILRSIITWAGTQKGVPTPYPHERIQSRRDSPALLFTTHPWRVSSCCLCEQRGSFINRGVEGWAGGSLTSCPGPPFAPPQRAPRSVLDQKKTSSDTATSGGENNLNIVQ